MKQWIRNSMYILAGLFVGLTLVPALANSPIFTTSFNTSFITEAEAIDAAMNYTDEVFELVSVKLDDDDREYEIILVNNEKSVEVDVNAITGVVDDWDVTWIRHGDLISVEEAKAIALNRAGEGFSLIEIKLDDDDDDVEYEITLLSEGFKIEVEIDAKTGEIIKWEAEGLVSQVTNLISIDEVKRIVLERAGTSYVVISVELDNDDQEYYVTLSSVDSKIKAEVDAVTGQIKDWDIIDLVSGSSSQVSQDDSSMDSNDSSSNVKLIVMISKERAIEIARSRIGDAPVLIKLELDYDDGHPYYDIEFKSDDIEYEFEIDGIDGTILEFEIDD